MTLINRMARLFKADMHGILDWLEEPEAVLKQAVRDMETTIDTAEQAVAALVRKEAQLQAAVNTLTTAITELDHHIDLCFDEANEALARTFVSKKLATEKRLAAARYMAAEVAARKEAQQRQIAIQRQQLKAIVDKMQLFVEHASSWSEQEAAERGDYSVADEEVEVAFMREKRRRSGRQPAEQ